MTKRSRGQCAHKLWKVIVEHLSAIEENAERATMVDPEQYAEVYREEVVMGLTSMMTDAKPAEKANAMFDELAAVIENAEGLEESIIKDS